MLMKKLPRALPGIGNGEEIVSRLLTSSVNGGLTTMLERWQPPGEVGDEAVLGGATVSEGGRKINGLEAAMGNKEDAVPTSLPRSVLSVGEKYSPQNVARESCPQGIRMKGMVIRD
jgi:hypothetical protein